MKLQNTLASGILSALALSASLTFIPVHSAQAWWSCNTGWELQIQNNNKVRCYSPEQTQTRSILSCPQVRLPGTNIRAGTTLRRDYSGNQDKCVVLQSGYNIPVACPSGYRLQVRNGQDNCFRTSPAQEKAPDRNVN